MKQKLFISYSRHQTPFVDRLAGQLDKLGYQLWLDYRSLVPAKPWRQQIEAGIADTDAVLLVVSKDSIESQNVVEEWQHALEKKKRIILLIFEACSLPFELQNCEWVDFRVNYKKSLKQLETILDERQSVMTIPPPQKEFKAHNGFWLAVMLSIFVIIGSIPTWWTIFIPYILLPLPWKIYKRNYIFSRVVPVLLFLPILLFISSSIFAQGNIFYSMSDFASTWIFPTTLLSWALAVLILSSDMQRRALPEAAKIKFAHPLITHIKQPLSIVYTIDFAPEDRRYAKDLQLVLKNYGHRLATTNEKPDVVFVLISTYKKSTEYNPDYQVVYPLILQSVADLAPNLQRIQWIDFRKGIRNADKLAQLLPEPEKLLKALAVAPTGSQEVFPISINVLEYFYILVGMVGMGGLLITILSYGNIVFRGNINPERLLRLLFAVINGGILFLAVILALHGVRSRKGGTASLYPLLVLTVLQGLACQANFTVLSANPFDKNQDLILLITSATNGITTLICILFPIGLLSILPFLLVRGKEIYRWLPRQQDSNTLSRLEIALLLYTPARIRTLILHGLFHTILLFCYWAFITSIWNNSGQLGIIVLILPLFFTALGIRWLARRF